MKRLTLFVALAAMTGCAGLQKTAEKAAKDHPEVIAAIKEKAVKAIEGLVTKTMTKYLEPDWDEQVLDFSVRFAFDSDELDAEALAEAVNIAQWMKDNDGSAVLLIGRTDRHGPEEYNILLGSRRANRVAEAVWRQGIEHPRINALSAGTSEPSGDGDAADRSVKVVGARRIYKELRRALK